MVLATCPGKLPEDLAKLVAQFAAGWAASTARPCPAPHVLDHWTQLVHAWAEAPDLPLLLRKHRSDRGTLIEHASGRTLIPSDNSAAHWAYSLASEGECPTLDDIRSWFACDRVPVVMIQKTVEREKASHHCRLSPAHDVTEKGWKLAHIDPVGLNTRVPLAALPIETLKTKFINLVSPRNMFVIPSEWGGLAETAPVIETMKAWNERVRSAR